MHFKKNYYNKYNELVNGSIVVIHYILHLLSVTTDCLDG